MKTMTSPRYDLNGLERKTTKSSTCSECGHKAKSPAGLQIHIFRTHTARGRKIAKRAGLNFMKGSVRGKATRKLQHKKKRRWTTTIPAAEVHYCPRCGLNIQNVSIAVAHGG